MSNTDLPALSDEELVARAQQRDQESLAHLYERYYDRIYRYALARLGSVADAEDLAQETFLRMVDRLGTFRWQGAPFAAWLFRIANNRITDLYRSRARRGQQVPIEAIAFRASSDPEVQVERALSIAEVARGMEKLTQAQQEVLALRFGAELSVSETAKTLGKAEGTIKATQLQALQALRRILVTKG